MGSGSQFPFLIHVDELGPSSTYPDEQLNVMLLLSIAGSVNPMISTTLLSIRPAGFPQLATVNNYFYYNYIIIGIFGTIRDFTHHSTLQCSL